jgi:tRNA(Met) C34 N-acetyltransferase TmcA
MFMFLFVDNFSSSGVIPRFNERFILSVAACTSCLVVDDELNILPISKNMINITPVTDEEIQKEKELFQQWSNNRTVYSPLSFSSSFPLSSSPSSSASSTLTRTTSSYPPHVSAALSFLPPILTSSTITITLLTLTKTNDQAVVLASLLHSLAGRTSVAALTGKNDNKGQDGVSEEVGVGETVEKKEGKGKSSSSSSSSFSSSFGASVVSLQAGRGRGKSAALVIFLPLFFFFLMFIRNVYYVD